MRIAIDSANESRRKDANALQCVNFLLVRDCYVVREFANGN